MPACHARRYALLLNVAVMGLLRHGGVEADDLIVDAESGEVVYVPITHAWVNSAVASAIAVFLVYTGTHEIAAIRSAVHIVKDWDGADAVVKTFNIDA